MPVAKSYMNNKLIGEPFVENGRSYIYMETEPKPGVFSKRKVRWYTDAEFKRMYPDVEIPATTSKFYKSQKEILGFGGGPLTIFKGKTYDYKDYLKEIGATYRKWWGWGLPYDKPIPDDLPSDLTPVKVEWELVGNEDGNLKPDDQIKTAIESLIYDPGCSNFVGQVGERLTLTVTITKNIPLEGYYGLSHVHTMEDENGNVYVWITGSKDWEVGTVKTIKGSVKEHKIFRNTKQTVLTRCAEVK